MKNIKETIHILLDQIGFFSLNDWFQSAFAWKHKSLYVFSVGISGFLFALREFTDTYIYNPSLGIVVLFVSTILDMIFGASVAIEENRFNPKKLLRAMMAFFVQVAFIGLFFQMSIAWNILGINKFMVDAMIISFTASSSLSAMKNAYKLGFISKEVYEGIKNVINVKNILSKFKNK